MILLGYDYLIFEMSTGENIPFSAEMISIEMVGESGQTLDPETVQHAAAGVFHYFKHDLGRLSVTVGEFTLALEKVLRGFNPGAQPRISAKAETLVGESDLRELADESGEAELIFFTRMRDELRTRLQQSPRTLRFR